MESVINVRVDTELKKGIEALYSSMGMDISTATRLFYTQCLAEQGLPFRPQAKADRERFGELIDSMREEARRHGFMSMEQINAEIEAARAETRERNKAV